jgi:hypothetical protein
MIDIVKAAKDVVFFTKHNDYPEIHSSGFQELTTLLNKLEYEINKNEEI